MDITIIYIALFILGLSLALNLKLTFKLNEKISHLTLHDNSLLSVDVGEKLPDFKGKTFIDQSFFHLQEIYQPAVLIFLSSDCPTCKGKISDLEAILPLISSAGLLIKFISHESKRAIQKFLGDSPLRSEVILSSKKQYEVLNPRYSSPFYLFVNHSMRLEAAGFIGDDNWIGFVEQIVDTEKV